MSPADLRRQSEAIRRAMAADEADNPAPPSDLQPGSMGAQMAALRAERDAALREQERLRHELEQYKQGVADLRSAR